MIDLFMSNMEAVTLALAFLASIIFAAGTIRRKRFKAVNDIILYAFMQIEKVSEIKQWKGYTKLKEFMTLWEKNYRAKFGKDPSEEEVQRAQDEAARLAAEEKAFRLANPQ